MPRCRGGDQICLGRRHTSYMYARRVNAKVTVLLGRLGSKPFGASRRFAAAGTFGRDCHASCATSNGCSGARNNLARRPIWICPLPTAHSRTPSPSSCSPSPCAQQHSNSPLAAWAFFPRSALRDHGTPNRIASLQARGRGFARGAPARPRCRAAREEGQHFHRWRRHDSHGQGTRTSKKFQVRRHCGLCHHFAGHMGERAVVELLRSSERWNGGRYMVAPRMPCYRVSC